MVFRPIERILELRLRAASLNADAVAAKVRANPTDDNAQVLAGKAADALIKATRAVAVLQDRLPAGTPPDPYEPSTTWELERYAAQLVADDPTLTHEQALHEAFLDDRARADDWIERFAPSILKD